MKPSTVIQFCRLVLTERRAIERQLGYPDQTDLKQPDRERVIEFVTAMAQQGREGELLAAMAQREGSADQ